MLQANGSRYVGAVCAALIAVSSSPLPAQAAEPDNSPDAVIHAIEAVSPVNTDDGTEVAPVVLDATTTGFAGASDSVSFEVAEQAAAAVVIADDDSENLSIALPNVGAQAGTTTSDATAVVYSSGTSDTSLAVQAFQEGAQISTVIETASAPTSFTYGVDVPAGGSLRDTGDGGIALLDGAGVPVGYMAAPWARDATGNTVQTSYLVSGNNVIQTVSHRTPGVSYPVVADPYFFKDLIKSARWEWIKRSPGGAIGAGWTLRVEPTRWARWQIGAQNSYYAGVFGWRELRKKYPNSLNRNLDSMRDQYICHQQFVIAVRPNAPTWNLDEWRKDVSYLSTVRYQCNPPRGGKYAY